MERPDSGWNSSAPDGTQATGRLAWRPGSGPALVLCYTIATGNGMFRIGEVIIKHKPWKPAPEG